MWPGSYFFKRSLPKFNSILLAENNHFLDPLFDNINSLIIIDLNIVLLPFEKRTLS